LNERRREVEGSALDGSGHGARLTTMAHKQRSGRWSGNPLLCNLHDRDARRREGRHGQCKGEGDQEE